MRLWIPGFGALVLMDSNFTLRRHEQPGSRAPCPARGPFRCTNNRYRLRADLLRLTNAYIGAGVLTKPDLIQEGEEDGWLKILQGSSHQLTREQYLIPTVVIH